MKKHDGGYALVLVLIVLIVLGLLVSFMLSFSLQHVQTQKKYIDQMQEQYAAAGQIEMVVGKLQALIDSEADTVNLAGTEVDPDEKTVTVSATYGTVNIQCVLRLEATHITPMVGTTEYKITGLTGMEYISYEISTVQEVTPDE